MDKLTIALAIIATLEAGVVVWLCLILRADRAWHASRELSWFAHRDEHDHELARLRAEINKSRRNTGKAEM